MNYISFTTAWALFIKFDRKNYNGMLKSIETEYLADTFEQPHDSVVNELDIIF